MKSQCGRVIADIEACSSGREHEVDVVELVFCDLKRVPDRRDARSSVACEVVCEADEQGDEEAVLLVVSDIKR